MSGNAIKSPDDQEIGWGFQILPFIEEQGLYDLRQPGAAIFTAVLVERVIASKPITHYFCPSRRRPTTQQTRYLMDYASSVPTHLNLNNGKAPVFNYAEYWCDCGDPHGRNTNGTCKCKALGIVTRTPRFGKATRTEQVIDGLSTTMMYGEKWLETDKYDTGEWHDDRGWTDGYDPDVVRSTALLGRPDDSVENNDDAFAFGGVHTGGFNACFGDGAVHFISYDTDPIIYNRWGNRRDDQPASSPGS
jgi:hypothetical protein